MGSALEGLRELTSFLLGVILFVCLAWVVAPRTWYFSNTQIIYTVETTFCNQYNVCDVKTFFDPLKIRVDKSKSEVVWMGETLGTWRDCVILDKRNWRCNDPSVSMVDGSIESKLPSLSYISGWSYRLYWLLSFLPDLR